MNRVGICFTGQPYSLSEVVRAARRAEQLGYDSVWIAEDDWTGRDAITVLTAVALATSRIRVGTSLVGATTRHPVLTAMTFNTLREIAPGRLVLGIGLAGGWRSTSPSGAGWGDRSDLSTMRVTVRSLKALLAGGTVEWGDKQRAMMVPRPWFQGGSLPSDQPVPVYMGAVGPRMTRLAGEEADGLLLEMEAMPQSIRRRLELFRAGAADARRQGDTREVVKLILTSVTPTGEPHPNALGWAAKSVARLDDATVSSLGWDVAHVEKVRKAWAAGEWAAGRAAMTPAMTRPFVSYGRDADVAAYVREIVGLGVSLPVLLPYGGDVEAVLQAGARYAAG